MVARCEDVELVAVAEAVQFLGGGDVVGRRDQLVDQRVPHQERDVAQRGDQVVVAAEANGRLRLGEQVGELLGELEGAEAAHRVARDHGPGGVEAVAARDVGPHLEDVGPGVAVVEPVGAARFGRDDDRAAVAVAELRLVPASGILVVVRRQRVQEERHPVAQPRHRPGRNVDGVGLDAAEEVRAVVAVGGG